MFFEKVTYEQFKNDLFAVYPKLKKKAETTEYVEDHIKSIYDTIKLPERATKNSAGYDFFAPFDIYMRVSETMMIPTGIKVKLDDDKTLLCCPRSGQGSKYKLQMSNTIGVIDSDYYGNVKNEGHIFIKLSYDGFRRIREVENFYNKKDSDSIATFSEVFDADNVPLSFPKGTALCQGIITNYFTVDDDNVDTVRVGGIGSTDNK